MVFIHHSPDQATCREGPVPGPDVVRRTTIVRELAQAGATLPVALSAVGLGGED